MQGRPWSVVRRAVLVAVLASPVAIAGDDPGARALVEEYLVLPCPEDDRGGEARSQRLTVLRRLASDPMDAVRAISEALPAVESPLHRQELIETLGWIPTPDAAALLSTFLTDRDRATRRAVVLGLHRLSSRISRSGVVNVPAVADSSPRVAGLVPHLIVAARDADTFVRTHALFALADAREPAAAAELRDHLRDPDERIRATAACLLSELGDSTGLPEIGDAVTRLSDEQARGKWIDYPLAEHVLASLERLTGKSFGKIPMQPTLSSVQIVSEGPGTRHAARDQYGELLAVWARWWKDRDAPDR